MKRFLTILMITMMLLMFVSCDGGITGFMGQMGQNVMGSDTSKASAAADSTKVDEDKIEKPAEDGSYTLGGEGGITVTVDKDVTLLPPIENKDEVIKNIGSSLTSDANRDALIKEMSKAPSPAVQEAASGTAQVMNSVINEIVGEGTESSLPEEVKNVLESVTTALDTISKDSTKVTQADVVTLQLVTDMVVTLNQSKDDNGNLKITDKLLSDANNLITIASAISSAGNFNALEDINISDLIPNMGGSSTPAAASRAIDSEKLPEGVFVDENGNYDVTALIDSSNPNSVYILKSIRSAFQAITKVSGLNAEHFELNVFALQMHKFAYEAYVQLVSQLVNLSASDDGTISYDKHPYLESEMFKSFATYNNLFKYVIASVLAESDTIYNNFKTDVDETFDIDLSCFDNLIAILARFAELNPWLLDSSDVLKARVIVPSEFENIFALQEGSENQQDELEALANKFLESVHGTNGLKTAVVTIRNMLPFVKVDSFGTEIVKGINSAIKWFEEEYKPVFGNENAGEVR